MIELAMKVPLVLLKVEDYQKLRDEVFALRMRLSEAETQGQREREEQEFGKKRQIVMDRYERSDIGEEIVRLKRNIDRGLGSSDGSSQYTETFLSKYREVEQTLKELSR